MANAELISLLIDPKNAGAAGGVGKKAASEALVAGYSPAQITEALRSAEVSSHNTASQGEGGDQRTNVTGGVNQDLIASLSSTAPTSEWGTHGVTADDAAARGGVSAHDARSAHVGGADVAFMRHQGLSETEIQNYMGGGTRTNPNEPFHGSSNYSRMLREIDLGATNEAKTTKIGTLESDLGTLSGNYDTLQGHYDTLKGKYDTMGTQYTQLQKDVAQAAKDALKIKYTGSTAVQNPSAMGIQAAQGTPFRGSGLAGTAALARPNKGLKIKTLNV